MESVNDIIESILELTELVMDLKEKNATRSQPKDVIEDDTVTFNSDRNRIVENNSDEKLIVEKPSKSVKNLKIFPTAILVAGAITIGGFGIAHGVNEIMQYTKTDNVISRTIEYLPDGTSSVSEEEIILLEKGTSKQVTKQFIDGIYKITYTGQSKWVEEQIEKQMVKVGSKSK